MDEIKIIAEAKAEPRKVEKGKEAVNIADTSDEWIQNFQGNWQRKFCTMESCQILAVEAARKAVDDAGIEKEEIGMVLVATTTKDHVIPRLADRVQNALGLGGEVMTFDIGAAAAGFSYGLDVCQGLLASCKKKYALLVGSEQMSNISQMADRSICVLRGDGAQAAVLTI